MFISFINKMRIRFWLIAILIPLSVIARKKIEHPLAEIMVSYTYHETFVRGSDGVSERDYEFLLLANTEQSKFYPPISEYLDSLDSTPTGKAQYEQMLSAVMPEVVRTGNYSLVPSKKGHVYVFKNRKESVVSVYDFIGLTEFGYYTEPLAEMQWEVGDSTKNILGYDCIMAHANYHGRQWTVWFTPEIPLSEGPWKLCGLPGLILEASESSGQHSFMVTGIETSNKEMVPIYTPSKYEKLERMELLRRQRYYRDNQETLTNASFDNILGNRGSANAHKPVEKIVTDVDFLETDYRK